MQLAATIDVAQHCTERTAIALRNTCSWERNCRELRRLACKMKRISGSSHVPDHLAQRRAGPARIMGDDPSTSYRPWGSALSTLSNPSAIASGIRHCNRCAALLFALENTWRRPQMQGVFGPAGMLSPLGERQPARSAAAGVPLAAQYRGTCRQYLVQWRARQRRIAHEKCRKTAAPRAAKAAHISRTARRT